MAYKKQSEIADGNILKAEYLQKMEDGIIESFCKQTFLTSADDLNNITTPGEYCWSYAGGGVPMNAPVANSTMTLSVYNADSGDGATYPTTVSQFAKSGKYGAFVRNSSRNTGNFDTWLQLGGSSSSGVVSSGGGSPTFYDRKVALHYGQWTEPFTIVGDTYPTYGGSSVGYIPQGQQWNGIIYSSTFRDGSDVLWNFNPSTYYSAVANPASLLYTVDYRGKVFNEAAYMGSVCSTTALKALGYRYPWDTTEINSNPSFWRQKINTSIDNIEVGDILWKQGHVAGIVGVNIGDGGHVSSVLITEQAGYVSVFEKTAAQWDDYFSSTWTKIFRGQIDETLEAPIDHPKNHSIIFERGNNTYETDYSKMLFYIPEATTIYLTKDGTTSNYTKSSFSTETVNNTTVYNLASLFTGIGDYYFHTDIDTTKMCIKIISKGNISISNGKATLSGYSNCSPYGYRVIEILPTSESSKYNFWGAPEGYTSTHVLNSFEDVIDDTFTINKIPSHGRYLIEVYYDTGFGWARGLSAIQGM